jgi:hypothetical protein
LASLARLSRLTQTATSGAPSRADRDLVSYVTIETQNTWSNFVRAYYLSCFLGVRLRSGSRVGVIAPFAGTSVNDAIGYAVIRFSGTGKKRKPSSSGVWDVRDEPKWHEVHTLLTLCEDLQCSHIPQVRTAVSIGSSVFDTLPTFRNFFAHRNQGTERKAMALAPQIGAPSGLRPTDAVVYRPPTASTSALERWIIELGQVIEFLCA